MHDESHTNIPDDLVNSLSTRRGSYRSLSAKRPRDPSQRKSVSFNDVPIVHEVPSHDAMRNSNCDIYRSWTYTDSTPPVSVISPFSTSQILSPFNSTSAAAQKIHANRLSSALYSSTNSTTLNRLSEWTTRVKTTKSTDDTIEQNTTWNTPLIIVHTPDERLNKLSSSENVEEKKHPYRTAVVPENEHYRHLPFTYLPLSESTTTYTSMLSTNIIPSNHSSNEQNSSSTGHTRIVRARSATIPISITNSLTRNNNDNISITPLRTTTPTLSNSSLSRPVLKPTTVAFQCSQSIAATPTIPVNTISSLTNTNTITPKPPNFPSRLSSSTIHSRYLSSSNRPLSSSTIKYTYSNPTSDSTTQKSILTSFPRARSANILTTRRNATSPVVMIDGQSGGTHNNNNLYATTKRNPNVRQTYGSYYMHRVLLPANIN